MTTPQPSTTTYPNLCISSTSNATRFRVACAGQFIPDGSTNTFNAGIAIEHELADWKRDEHFRVERERRAGPLLEELHRSLVKKQGQLPPKTALGKAVTYALSQWSKMIRYLECEHLTPDTNRVGNAIGPFVLGRKNWVFAGSPRGANASMTLYSLIETAKANGVEPYWYQRALFDQLPAFDPSGNYEDLLPWNISIRKPEGY